MMRAAIMTVLAALVASGCTDRPSMGGEALVPGGVAAAANAASTVSLVAASEPAPSPEPPPAFGNLDPQAIAAFAGKRFSRGPGGEKKIALTFDDGPHPQLTPQVIDILRREEVPATFFMLGEMIRRHSATARLVAEAGFDIGNHSFSHPNLTRLPEGEVRRQITETNALIESIGGRRPVLFRPPGGAINATVRQVCEREGMILTLWSVDPEDWKSGSTEASILDKIARQSNGGGIVVLHDIHARTVAALPRIIAQLRGEGYRFVTVSELVRDAYEAGQRGDVNGEVRGGSPALEDPTATPPGIPLEASALPTPARRP